MFHPAGHPVHRWALLVAAASLLVAAAAYAVMRPQKSDANGLTVPIAQGAAGPYEYIVGIWPPDPGVGNLHISVKLASDQRPVTDAVVEVRARVAGQPEVVGPFRAWNYFQAWDYELDLSLNEPGAWTFEIAMNSPLGDTVVEVPLEVPEGRATGGGGFNWAIVAAPLAVAGLGATAWVVRKHRSGAKPADPQRPSRRGRRRER